MELLKGYWLDTWMAHLKVILMVECLGESTDKNLVKMMVLQTVVLKVDKLVDLWVLK